MNAQDIKTHFSQTMRNGLAEHLTAVHGITEVPKTRQAQDKLHRSIDHGQPAQDARTAADVSVLAGVTRKDSAPAANTPKPRPSARKRATQDVPLPGDSKPAGKTAAQAGTRSKPAASTTRSRARKPAQQASKPQPVPEPKPETNGTSPREHNQELARTVVTMLAKEFATASPDDWQKVANWLHALPTGGEGAGWLRWWPENVARPTSSGWRKPE